MVDTLEVVADRVRTHDRVISHTAGKVEDIIDDQHEIDLRQTRIEGALATIGDVKDNIEAILAKLSDIDTRLTVLESKSFDLVKVFKFFSTPWGVILLFGMVGGGVWGEDFALAVFNIAKGG